MDRSAFPKFFLKVSIWSIISVMVALLLRATFFEIIGEDISNFESLLGIVSTMYALIAAFIIVEIWNEFNSISSLIAREAKTLISIWNFVDYLNDPEIDKNMKPALLNYIDKVTSEEKSKAAKRDRAPHPSKELISIFRIIDKINFDDKRDVAVFPSIANAFEELSEVRSIRLDDSTKRLPPFLRGLYIFLSVLVILFFSVNSFVSAILYIVVLFILAGIIVSAFFLVEDMDNPFDGMWNVEYDPFKEARHYIETRECEV